MLPVRRDGCVAGVLHRQETNNRGPLPPRKKRNGADMKSFSRFLTGFLVLSRAPAVMARTPPPVSTNKPIYAPGEVVTVRGDGWSPGEPVTIAITAEGGGA